jgi:Flp pilus assembly protein TadG
MEYLMSRIRRLRRSRGAILVMAAFALVVMIGMAALAMDLGVLAMARGQLKTVGDAAALAGARQLATDNRIQKDYVPTAEAANAVSKATSIGQSNIVLSSNAVVQSGDVIVGTKPVPPDPRAPDPTDRYFQPGITVDTNSVQVTANRDGSHVGVVPAFFSRIWGNSGSTISVISTATVELFVVSGYTPTANNGDILPIALDNASWQALINNPSGQQDNYNYNPATGTVSNGPDGVHEIQLYPIGNQPGNYGTINYGVSSNSTQVLGNQIQYGITPSQEAAAPNGGNLTFPGSYTFTGDTGISAGIKDNLTAIIGQPRLLPLYQGPVVGNGNNAQYTIVGLAPVRIVAVDFQGQNKYVYVQPAIIDDPGATGTTPAQTWTNGGFLRLHISR